MIVALQVGVGRVLAKNEQRSNEALCAMGRGSGCNVCCVDAEGA